MIYLDLEADNLLRDATRIWCIVAFDPETNSLYIYHAPLDTGEEVCYPKNHVYYVYTSIQEYITNLYTLLTNNTLVTFNGISYDLPLLRRLHGFEYTLHNQVDLLLDSRLQYPDRQGHSLGYFGSLLGFPKGDHSDWTRFSQEMLDYCIQDVMVTVKTHQYLQKESEGWDWSESRKLEYKIADIQMRQEIKGVLFDACSANALSATIEAELDTLEEKIKVGLPKIIKQVGVTVNKPFKKNGGYTEAVNKWISEAHLQG